MKQNKLLFFIILLGFLSCKSVNRLADIEEQKYRVNSSLLVGEDAEIKQMIEPYKVQLDSKMNEVIGQTAKTLLKEKPEGTLGNFVADALKEQGSMVSGQTVDFAFQNYGGLRIGNLPKGDISVGKIFELMPFENILILVKLDREGLMQFLNHIAPSRGWPVSSGIQFEIENQKILNVLVNGEALEANKTYLVGFPDYIVNGGDNCDFLKEHESIDTGLLVRDAIINQIRALTAKGEMIDANKENRITLIE